MMRMRSRMAGWLVLGVTLGWVGCTGGQEDGSEEAASTADEIAGRQEESAAATMSAEEERAALHKADPVGSYGEELEGTPVAVGELLADSESLEGKRVAVHGVVEEVCPMRGCWIELADTDGTNSIRVKVVDGVIVFPLSAKGHKATVEGVLTKTEMDLEHTRAHLEHLAEEKGEPFDPESVQEPMTLWQIQGEAAEIMS